MTKKPTQEEINKAHENLEKFYDRELSLLRKKKEYYELRALSSKYEFEDAVYKIKLAELKNPEPSKSNPDGNSKSNS